MLFHYNEQNNRNVIFDIMTLGKMTMNMTNENVTLRINKTAHIALRMYCSYAERHSC